MSRPIEKALGNLIPRHSKALPPELVDLASSLLVQSRSKCTLKAEEEVARVYVCANLACERLKANLNLPPIEARPPILPRTYKKLFLYFDSQLGMTATPVPCRGKPVAKRRQTKSSNIPAPSPRPAQPSPSKVESTAGVRMQQPAIRKINGAAVRARYSTLPMWVGPVVRFVCKKMDTCNAIPHVLAGIESITSLPRPRKQQAELSDTTNPEFKLPALIAAVWFFVVVKMHGREEQWRENLERKKLIRDHLAAAKENQMLLERIGSSDEAWESWVKVTERDVNIWRNEIVNGNWKELDWWINIEEGIGVRNEFQDDEDELANSDTSGDSNRPDYVQARRINDVIWDKYDYLSTPRKLEYEAWRCNIQSQIDQMSTDKDSVRSK